MEIEKRSVVSLRPSQRQGGRDWTVNVLSIMLIEAILGFQNPNDLSTPRATLVLGPEVLIRGKSVARTASYQLRRAREFTVWRTIARKQV